MFDLLRNLTKSAGERRQEMLTAYLDDALSPRQRRQFERLLGDDPILQAELDSLRRLKAALRQVPRLPVPRHYTLDPALYGRPDRQPATQLYPAFRLATALTAVFFVVVVGLSVFQGLGSVASPSAARAPGDGAAAGQVALESAPLTQPAESFAAEEAVAEEAVAESAAPAAAADAAEPVAEGEAAVSEAAPAEAEAVVTQELEAPVTDDAGAGGDVGLAAPGPAATRTPAGTPAGATAATPVPAELREPAAPRPEPTATLPERAGPLASVESAATTAAEVGLGTAEAPDQGPLAVAETAGTGLSGLGLLAAGSGLLLVILVATTWLLRRRL